MRRTCIAALVLALACGAPLAGGGCGAGAAGGASVSSSGAFSALVRCPCADGGAPSWPCCGEACASCLEAKCDAEEAACTDECYGVQACIDAVCSHLSETGSSDEGACQVHCQGLHPSGKAAHLALVNCAADEPVGIDAGMSCMPPCAGAPSDFERCAAAQRITACATEAAQCASSAECQAYVACAGACTTFPACQACGAGSGAAGEALYEALTLCIARACLVEAWLPHE